MVGFKETAPICSQKSRQCSSIQKTMDLIFVKDTFIFRAKAKAIDLLKSIDALASSSFLARGSRLSFYIMFSLQLKVVGVEGEQMCTLPYTQTWPTFTLATGSSLQLPEAALAASQPRGGWRFVRSPPSSVNIELVFQQKRRRRGAFQCYFDGGESESRKVCAIYFAWFVKWYSCGSRAYILFVPRVSMGDLCLRSAT